MLNVNIHKSQLIIILRSIYKNPLLRNTLGFKGGTAAMLFYQLPRFSVDLDFDLLDPTKKDLVFESMKASFPSTGTLIEATEKRFSLFFLWSYETNQRQLKIDISKRLSNAMFTPMSYLGISMLVMNREDVVASKIAALLSRKNFAVRDIFDVWYFLKNNWAINDKLLIEKTGLPIDKALLAVQNKIMRLNKNELLGGLGELLDSKQKNWTKDHLVEETIFYLKLYEDQLRAQ